MKPRKNKQTFALLSALVRDAQKERGVHEDQWSRNRLLTLGVQGPHTRSQKHDDRHFVVNRIQNAVIVQTAVQTEEPPRLRFAPRETNEPPDIFLRPEAAQALPPGLGLTDAQLRGSEPIPNDLAEFLMQPRTQQDAVAGEQIEAPPALDPSMLVFVDDRLAAEGLTQEWQSEWESDAADEKVRTNIFDTNVIGQKDTLIQWDAEDNRFELVNLYPYNCWIDRWAESTATAESYVLRQVKDARKAKAEMSGFEDIIDEVVSTTNSDLFGSGADRGSKYDQDGERPVVEIWTAWIRNHKFDRSEEDALERKLVVPATRTEVVEVPDEMTGEPVSDIEEVPATDDDGQQLYRLVEDDSITKPGADNWPKRRGIRQIQHIGEFQIFDDEADFADIPVARNGNIPIPESPYFQGEPQRLEHLQTFYNRLWSIFHDYFKFFRSPETFVPKSVYDAISDAMDDFYSGGGRMVGVPDHLMQSFGGDIIKNIPVPQLGAAVFDMITLVGAEMDKAAGMEEVLLGRAKSEWSAKLFEQATNAARGPIGFKARHTAAYLKHLGKVGAQLIIDFLPTEEWVKRNKKYPAPVIEAMRSRLKRFGYDIVPEVSGEGVKERENQQLLALWQNGVQTPSMLDNILDKMKVPNKAQIVQEFVAMSAPPPAAPAEGEDDAVAA